MHAASEMALVKGMKDTRLTLARWQERPWPVLGAWVLASAAIAAALLLVVLLISALCRPDSVGVTLPGLTEPGSVGAVLHVFKRNLLVLALHGFACVAGFIAGSSLPEQAAEHRGLMRYLHEKAGPVAILFVVGATTFSLASQAFALGHAATTLGHQIGLAPGLLLVGILPHAIPELIALFLPLAAWMLASRRGDWHELLAATFVTVGLAIPVLVVAAYVEVYVSPHLILALRS